MNDVAPILLCEDLVVGHAGHAVMSDVNIRLPAGKVVAIVGPSGCGKSTLMRVLGGLDEPMSGRSELLGTDLVHATAAERESVLRRSGFLFQGAALFSSLTLRENVELPLREFLPIPPQEIAQLAEYKLALVGLADAMEAGRRGGDGQQSAGGQLLAEDRPVVAVEERDELVVRAPTRAVVVLDCDGSVGHGWTPAGVRGQP